MGSILETIEDWIRGLLVSGIMGNLTSIFDSVNNQVGQIATEVRRTPDSRLFPENTDRQRWRLGVSNPMHMDYMIATVM